MSPSLVGSQPFDHFSHKQLREIVSWVTERLYQLTPELSGRLGLVKFEVREKILGLIERGTDRQPKKHWSIDAIAAQPSSRASTLLEMSDRLPITRDSGSNTNALNVVTRSLRAKRSNPAISDCFGHFVPSQ